jgi:hypothetical protein
MRTWLALLAALMLFSCAPRQSKTHYTRWAEETEKRKAEEAQEEAAKEKATAEGTKKAPPPATTRSTTPPPSDYSSLPPGDTPDITRTATRARVIKPEEKPDEDVIY